ncbi:hypothetical protein [Janthinobacterium fluminis]|uniref:Uncharacterized protein n=1 Tax=Janthinobacterium fluminis TaxID=2987524 RepID=A0ABT5JU09_9BURK|nr:hypothetical protein [Janthinobacterium fluminis]MDC8756233.1 hypothetical protein [Janthinobacterium fluminis]
MNAATASAAIDQRLSRGDCTAITNTQRQADHIQAHADFLTERQRKSGIRTRLCSTGCYSMYDAKGYFIGRTPPPGTLLGVDGASLREAAARMAMSAELLGACRLVDQDWTAAGAVSAETVAQIRDLLSSLAAK